MFRVKNEFQPQTPGITLLPLKEPLHSQIYESVILGIDQKVSNYPTIA